MARKRIKIDVNDVNGNKITITLEGRLNRDKIIQVLDLIDLLAGSQMINVKQDEPALSKFEKVQHIIWRKFPTGWFTSQDVVVAYEDIFNEPIGLSTVSTYLSRLTRKNILNKSGSSNKRKYRTLKKFFDKDKKIGYIMP